MGKLVMAWPDDLSQVECAGFDRAGLPFLQKAIDNKHVKWGRVGGFGPLSYKTFDYLGFRYRVDGNFEFITRIEKLFRIDEDEDGEEVVVRIQVGQVAQYADWNSF